MPTETRSTQPKVISLDDLVALDPLSSADAKTNNLTLSLANKTFFVHETFKAGLGSNLVNLFGVMAYVKKFYPDRTFVLDESRYPYRRSTSRGLFTGYMSPQFPVVDTATEKSGLGNYKLSKRVQRIPTNDAVISFHIYLFRRLVREEIVKKTESKADLLELLASYACPSVKYNTETVQDVQELHKSLPGFEVDDMVAFHIRRGDKLRRESRKFLGEEYVTKYLQVNRTQHKYCFVATDDYEAVSELQEALLAQNVNCQLMTLTQPTQRGSSKNDEKTVASTIQLLAEVDLIVRANVFVGTMNSNVGSLAGILRACHGNASDEFAQSYGVDHEWDYR